MALDDQRVVIARSYRLIIVDGETRAITCARCGLTSCHPVDVSARYCVRCHIFHDDEHEDQHAP